MALLPYKDTGLSIDARVEDLIARMTLDEKLAQLGGVWSRPLLQGDQIEAFRSMTSARPDPEARHRPHLAPRCADKPDSIRTYDERDSAVPD